MTVRNFSLVENPPIVKISHLHKRFDDVAALSDISLDIPEGKIIGLVGPNSAGKSTLIKILAGLYTGYEGEVTIDGKRPGAATKAKTVYLPDRPFFSLKQTPEQIRKIYEEFFEDFDRERFDELMDIFDVRQDKPFKEMSKGMIDKVQISLAMARRARLYLLDEPLGGVDVAARDNVLDMILESFDSGSTIIVATHLISEIERLFDSVIVLKEGRLLMHHSCDELRQKYGSSIEEAMKAIF